MSRASIREVTWQPGVKLGDNRKRADARETPRILAELQLSLVHLLSLTLTLQYGELSCIKIQAPTDEQDVQPVLYEAKAQSEWAKNLASISPNGNAHLSDLFSSQESNPDKPITCGMYRQAKGEPLVYTYELVFATCQCAL